MQLIINKKNSERLVFIVDDDIRRKYVFEKLAKMFYADLRTYRRILNTN